MKVLEQVQITLDWADMNNLTYHPRPQHKRSPGVHLSQIIRHIAIKLGKLKDEDRNDEYPLVMFLGQAFEESAARLYPAMEWQPAELFRDDVYGSMDGKDTISEYTDLRTGVRTVFGGTGGGAGGGRRLIDEFKLTYTSAHTKLDIREQWMYLTQGLGYCAMDADQPRLIRYHRLFVCGNYRPPFPPQYWRTLVEVSEEEVEKNWSMIQKYKTAVEPEGMMSK